MYMILTRRTGCSFILYTHILSIYSIYVVVFNVVVFNRLIRLGPLSKMHIQACDDCAF
jgi:hypothetical protein